MTYRWIDDNGLLKKMLGERRIDRWTVDNVQDALRARGGQAAASAFALNGVRRPSRCRRLLLSDKPDGRLPCSGRRPSGAVTPRTRP